MELPGERGGGRWRHGEIPEETIVRETWDTRKGTQELEWHHHHQVVVRMYAIRNKHFMHDSDRIYFDQDYWSKVQRERSQWDSVRKDWIISYSTSYWQLQTCFWHFFCTLLASINNKIICELNNPATYSGSAAPKSTLPVKSKIFLLLTHKRAHLGPPN